MRNVSRNILKQCYLKLAAETYLTKETKGHPPCHYQYVSYFFELRWPKSSKNTYEADKVYGKD